MYLVSPTDRDLLDLLKTKANAISHWMPEKYGADVLAIVPGRGKLAVQRKTFPEDLVASLEDGRLAREVMLLPYAEWPILIAEGVPHFTSDGHWMHSYDSRWTKQGLRNILRSLRRVHNIEYERTDNLQDTVDAILELTAHFSETVHRSIITRPKHVAKDSWGLANKRDFARFMLQGFPGVGVELAETLFDHFGKIPLRWDCSKEDLKMVYGIGPKRVQVLWDTLEKEG